VVYGEPTLKPVLTTLGALWRAKGNSRVHVFVAPTALSFEQIARDTRCDVIFALAGPATDADRWPGTDGEVYELRIYPERTGQGHGSRLLHAVADTLIEGGFHTVSIWALEADTALRRFLEASGWAADGARAELDVGTSVPAVRLHTAISE